MRLLNPNSRVQLIIVSLLTVVAIVRCSSIQPGLLGLIVPATATAIVTPKPSEEEKAEILAGLEKWLPTQSNDLPRSLSRFVTEKHDTADKVEESANERSLRGDGTGWVVPFENEDSANQGSGLPPVLTYDKELTELHWGNEPTANEIQDLIDSSEGQTNTSTESQYLSLAPIVEPSGTQVTDTKGGNQVAGDFKRTDSAPFYEPPSYEEATMYGNSSAEAWGE
jgi:hypothetical protein